MTHDAQASSEQGCVFCRIVKGEAPAEIVNECEGAITIVPRDPVTKGHLLVIPRQHAEYLWNLHPQHLAHTAFEVASQAYDAWDNVGGVNVIQSNGSPATQTVWHVHFHIVPRYAMDGLKLPWSGGQHMHPGFTEVEQEAAEFDFIHQANALKWVPELVEIEVPDE